MNSFSTPVKAAIVLGVCGFISGILSTFVPIDVLSIGKTPMAPALYFGLVLAFGIYFWETRRPLVLLAVFCGVAFGWWCAINVGAELYEYNRLLAGAAAGFIGSAVTAAAIWFAAKDFRFWYNLAAVVGFGTLAGALLGADELTPLFTAWQAGVAGLVGYAVGLRPRS